MEHPGHLEGMLDRDQRTAKLRFLNESDIMPVPKTCSFQDRVTKSPTPTKRHCCCPTRTKRSSSSSTNSSHLACRNGYLLNTFQSVKNVLIVICLTLVMLPTINSAPTDNSASSVKEMRMASRMKWINPCDTNSGGDVTENANPSEFNSTEIETIIRDVDSALIKAVPFSDKFSKISVEATSALDQATGFQNDFALKKFEGNDRKGVHEDFKNHKLPWLELDWLGSKTLDEKIPDENLANLKIDDVLVNVYGILQRLAVGLEQITWDQKDEKDDFEKEFEETEHHLKRVLCELLNVIEAHKLERRPDVTRDIMSEDDRKGDTTARKVRDWIIFRDYMNSLQFLHEALEHLNKGLKTSR